MKGYVKQLVHYTTPHWARNWYRRLVPHKHAYKDRSRYEADARIGVESPNAWIRKSAEIGGWLFPGEHEFLWELATRTSSGDVLEIGTWLGKSACIFAGACKEFAPGTRVVCVDTFCMTGTADQEVYHRRLVQSQGTFYEFISNARRLQFDDAVVPVAAMSTKALAVLRGSFRLAFIDGAHDRINCARDVELSIPLLASGGVLAVHDSVGGGWPEVEAYVQEVLLASRQLRLIGERGTITAFQKTS